MRTLAIGDIHGVIRALDALLSVVGLTADDRLITLGDYVDRGPDSRAVLGRLIALHERGQLVAIRGNHDEMMLDSRTNRDARRTWLHYGGIQTLESYGHRAADEKYDRVPERHWRFLDEACRDYHETESHLFVHSNVDPGLPMEQQTGDVLRWCRLDEPVAHYSGKVAVCGHTLQDTGVPLDWGSVVCIDTGIYLPQGWLTCMDVEARYYWQANPWGQTRQGTLEELSEMAEW